MSKAVETIRYIMENERYTQAYIARATDMSPASIHQMLSGDKDMQFTNFKKILSAMDKKIILKKKNNVVEFNGVSAGQILIDLMNKDGVIIDYHIKKKMARGDGIMTANFLDLSEKLGYQVVIK